MGWGVEVEAIEDIGFDALALNEAGDFPPTYFFFFEVSGELPSFWDSYLSGGQFTRYISLIYNILESF